MKAKEDGTRKLDQGQWFWGRVTRTEGRLSKENALVVTGIFRWPRRRAETCPTLVTKKFIVEL